jgi:hypothetical protein
MRVDKGAEVYEVEVGKDVDEGNLKEEKKIKYMKIILRKQKS